MAIAFVLVGGISGFVATLITLLLGHGLGQALLNYGLVAASALIALSIMYLGATIFRALRAQFSASVELAQERVQSGLATTRAPRSNNRP